LPDPRFSDIVRDMKGFLIAGLMLFAAAGSAAAQTTVLYDAAPGTPPTAQGWLTYFSSDFGNHFTSDTTGTVLSTNANPGIQAGFSNHSVFTGQPVNPAFPALDRAAGFTVRLEDLRILSETHASIDRAGTSLIVLAGDKRGIEVGFWEGLVFAQNDSPLFTHGEQAGFNTNAAHDYDLRIQGSTYTLLADGNPILTGPLRDYAAFTGFPDPYELPNFIFLGDDTGSASAAARFAGISVTVVPEPASLSLLAVAATALLVRRRHLDQHVLA
jgi:hypothetical protein